MNIGALSSFRTYAATDDVQRVTDDLMTHVTPYAVVHRGGRGEPSWYLLRVDDELLERLRSKRGSLHSALSLRRRTAPSFSHRGVGRHVVLAQTMVMDRGRSLGNVVAGMDVTAGLPTVVLDADNRVHAVVAEPAAAGTAATLYPAVATSDGVEVEPEQVVEYTLTLQGTPPAGISPTIDVRFPDGAQTLRIDVTVSSTEFAPVDGPWSGHFVVNRRLECTPGFWSFKARALGERQQFTLTLMFFAAGGPVGKLTYVARRRGTPSAGAARSTTAGLKLPQDFGARALVSIEERAGNSFVLTLFDTTGISGDPVPWAIEAGRYFENLQRAASWGDVRDIGFGLWTDLPVPVRAFLERRDFEGQPTMFVSNGRVAPFEILQLHPERNGPLLGVERPVGRWVHEGMATTTTIRAPRVVCIRPRYPDKPLLSAEGEQEDLAARFPTLEHVATETELDRVLGRPEFGVVHFAGHGEGSPNALLWLEDNRAVSPTKFHSSSPLIKERRPFFFLNACKVSRSPSLGTFDTNFPKVLIAAGFSAVVAPLIEIDSPAARRASECFYEAVTGSATIAEAVRRIRELAAAASVPEADKPTYLSYLAFAPLTLGLQF